VDPRTGTDTVVKRKISTPSRESNPRTPIVQARVGKVRNTVRINLCSESPKGRDNSEDLDFGRKIILE
jgi:hypothetical protein